MRALTAKEKKEQGQLGVKVNWPNHGRTMHKAYVKLQKALVKELQESLGRQLLKAERPTPRAVKQAAKKWTRTFLQKGHVLDESPHKANYKVNRNKEHLQAIRGIILDGYVEHGGNKRLYRDMYHLQRVQAEQEKTTGVNKFKEHLDACKVKTMRGLWKQLRTLYPAMHKVAIRLKKERDSKAVRVCLQTTNVCGLPIYLDLPAWALHLPAWALTALL